MAIKCTAVDIKARDRQGDGHTDRQIAQLLNTLPQGGGNTTKYTCTLLKKLSVTEVCLETLRYLERLNDVVLVALEEVRPHFAVLADPLPANGKPAPGHGGRPVGHEQLVVVEVVLHDVDRVVPVQRVVEHDRVRLLDPTVRL